MPIIISFDLYQGQIEIRAYKSLTFYIFSLLFCCTVLTNTFIPLNPRIFHHYHFAAFLAGKTVKGVFGFFPIVFKNFRDIHNHFFGRIHHFFDQGLYHFIFLVDIGVLWLIFIFA